MQAGFRIDFEDGTSHQITVAIPDFIQWANWSGKRAEEISNGDLEDWIRCLHWAATRQGHTEEPWDVWSARIVDLERLEMPDPKAIQKAHSKGS